MEQLLSGMKVQTAQRRDKHNEPRFLKQQNTLNPPQRTS